MWSLGSSKVRPGGIWHLASYLLFLLPRLARIYFVHTVTILSFSSAPCSENVPFLPPVTIKTPISLASEDNRLQGGVFLNKCTLRWEILIPALCVNPLSEQKYFVSGCLQTEWLPLEKLLSQYQVQAVWANQRENYFGWGILPGHLAA